MAKPQQPDAEIRSTDFIQSADRDADPTEDEGRVPVLEEDGKLSPAFQSMEESILQIPAPITFEDITSSLASATTMKLGMIRVTAPIMLASISFRIASVTFAGTLDISLYSQDGATRILTVTTPTITTTGNQTVTLASPIKINIGDYYIGFNANGPANINPSVYREDSGTFGSSTLGGSISGKPRTAGTVSISSGTPPSTINPNTITAANSNTLVVRFDS